MLSADQTRIYSTPYTDLGGHINTLHLVFKALDTTAFSAVPLGGAGSFSTNNKLETKSLSVLTELKDDYQNRATRGDRSQYRLEFPTVSDFDGVFDAAAFSPTSVKMVVKYLIN